MANKDILFRTDVVRAGGVRVSRANEVIEGFAVVTKGVTHDERGEFDDPALGKIIELGNQAKMGIKSRFGHPNMSSTALGTFLGRVRNFRRDGDIVRADLHIDPTAHQTPDGDLASYVMDLAQSDPAAFGSSMVIHWDEEYRQEKDGSLTKDEKGNVLPPLIRVKKLQSVDIVDDPAANNGLFGETFFSESVKPSAEMTAFLDRFLNHPEAVDKVIAFLERYSFNKNKIKEEGRQMFEDLTLEKLKAERSDLYNSVHALGVEEGTKKERERAVSILKKSKAFKDMTDLAVESIETGASFDQAVIKFQDKQLEGLQKTSAPGVGPDNDEDPAKKQKTHLERARAYKQEHNCSMTEALRQTAEKRNSRQ